MKTYVVLYFIPDGEHYGVDSMCIQLNYPLTSFTLRRVELRLRKKLGVKDVAILTYKEVSQ